jgi:hypothetical protein
MILNLRTPFSKTLHFQSQLSLYGLLFHSNSLYKVTFRSEFQVYGGFLL